MAQFGDFTVDRNSTKYVLGSGGTIISYATDEPAFEFNADGSYKGLLVEPAATNLCLRSEDLSTTWTPTNSPTITTNIAVAPDGTTTADGLEDTTGTNYKRAEQLFTVSANATYTASVFVKKETSETAYGGVGLTWSGTAVKTAYFIFDAVNGTANIVKTVASASVVVQDYGTYWRFCCTATDNGSNTTLQISLYATLSTNGTSAGVGIGSVRTYWGAQVEAGPIATSYMPTTISPFTRGKDEASMTNVSGLIGQKEGTLYLEVDWKAASGTIQVLLEADDGTGSNRILIYNTSGDALFMYARAGGATPATNQGVSSSAYSGIQKIAYAYKTDDFELYVNGSSVSSNTSGSLAALATLTDIDLGQDYAANVQANMHIRAVQIIPRRLSDAQLIELTS